MIIKKRVCILLIFAIFFGTIGGNGTYAATSFSDLKQSHWAYDNIMKLVDEGVINGYPNGTFLPEANITEAEFLKMALIAGGKYKEPESHKEAMKNYPDSKYYWYSPYFVYARENNIHYEGYGTANNAGNRYYAAYVAADVSVRELDETLVNIPTSLEAEIPDIKAIDAAWAASGRNQSVRHCYALGIITGYTDGSFGGDRNITRAEAATIICRLMFPDMRAEDKSSLKERNDWINAQLAVIIKSGMTEKEKAVAIAEWLCEYQTYWGEGDGKIWVTNGDCQSYASKYYWLATFAGLECKYIGGYTNVSHGWNKVKCDGVWYYIDVTWMDNNDLAINYTYSLSTKVWSTHTEVEREKENAGLYNYL